MGKETVICIIAIVLIIIGNNISNSYAQSEMGEISDQLGNLREMLNKDVIDKQTVSSKMSEIFDDWKQKYIKLAYFIEHDELEKVEVGLTETKGNIDVEQYNEAIIRLDYSNYIITHIEDKLNLKLENIF